VAVDCGGRRRSFTSSVYFDFTLLVRSRAARRSAPALLGKIAIGDWLTVAVAAISVAVLFRWKVSNPLLLAAAAVVGLVAFPLLKPDWVFVKEEG
jgi:hypothetical protein